ncbi:ead/Ea22-like family protein [Lelliottia sp. V89_10]|uniref:ead/Ea22-like family protein n=1 Tax=Lelliottia wanjuensis TaxID=3050585 RepID=UPI00249EDF7D|nr:MULTISPECIES: ead/Ea22-like family protein [unclassified Lelliottia]MDI3361176.1 ead/Ea22-like family protein [Lelliottia sp. V89_13]MDK9551275.1 ead/Ea22-like family protein [Lelliottia sp. V89_5]MDK9597453.1 ead/Ea22-like family protein [Lelliottia sp. V89_10]
MSTNKQALRSKARSASAGEWIKESGDGWDAICSSDDQANCSFVIAHFEGPDSKANREFVQAANPDVVLALLDELEAAERQNGFLRKQRDEWERKAISNFEECTEMATRIEDLESQRQLAFTASNRWADKFREAEKRIAELEARAVELPLPGCTYADHSYPAYTKRQVLNLLAAAGITVKGE